MTRYEKRLAWKRSTVRAKRRRPSKPEIWRQVMPNGLWLLKLSVALLSVVFLTGCGHRRAELITASCPEPPLLPAALKAPSPLETVNWDELTLAQFPESEP